ncbi:hypothetical protein HCH_04059 [Hahella chejuensis KCTC 2396]|uniref:Uncharacterized protein n=1 Tax=Hahella chejuensis (strain KCTC 2396) TaxID=349521 RepID=Q2SF00_HAHCH|nr:hypothetical protein [Hahella chejuensis]ABC30774.1 hypothetical protein HCH_04059 [Hahella chejuensis KCTC 2396]
MLDFYDSAFLTTLPLLIALLVTPASLAKNKAPAPLVSRRLSLFYNLLGAVGVVIYFVSEFIEPFQTPFEHMDATAFFAGLWLISYARVGRRIKVVSVDDALSES